MSFHGSLLFGWMYPGGCRCVGHDTVNQETGPIQFRICGMTPCRQAAETSAAEAEGPAHQGRVTRERTEEGVVAARIQAVGGERDRGALAAADHVGVCDHPVVVRLDIVLRRSGRQPV